MEGNMESQPGIIIGPRNLPITNSHFSFSNVEAWLNIIRSYAALHPRHEVTIFYEGEAIQNKISLFKLERPLNTGGFEISIALDDGDESHVTKLIRLLIEILKFLLTLLPPVSCRAFSACPGAR